MDVINSMIFDSVEHGTYTALAGTLGHVFMLLTVLWYGWRMRLHPLKALTIAYLGFFFTTNWNGIVLAWQTGFENVSRVNLAVAFVYLLPLAWLMAKLFRLRWQVVSELFALSILAFHIPGRSGCIFTGCCYGYPCEWGIHTIVKYYDHSVVTDDRVFPVVFVESLMSLGILIFLIVRVWKKSYVPDGKTLPWMLLLYGIGRFFTEFLHDNEKIWLGCSDIAFHALFMALVGGGMLLWLHIPKMYRDAKH